MCENDKEIIKHYYRTFKKALLKRYMFMDGMTQYCKDVNSAKINL